MKTRKETPADYADIYDLVEVAFQTARVSNGREQDLVDNLRRTETYIPELAMVAEEDGKLVGHIMLTKHYITSGTEKFEILLLSLVSVAFKHRKNGVGARLIEESFKTAKKMGYKAVIVVGDPEYFHRFGFVNAGNFGIKHVNFVPDYSLMVYELFPGALQGISGTTDC